MDQPVLQLRTLSLVIRNVSQNLAGKFSANFVNGTVTEQAFVNIVVLEPATCGATYHLRPLGEEMENVSPNNDELQEVTNESIITENSPLELNCHVVSYCKNSSHCPFPIWDSDSSMLFEVINKTQILAGGIVTSNQRSVFIAARISRFDRITCNVHFPFEWSREEMTTKVSHSKVKKGDDVDSTDDKEDPTLVDVNNDRGDDDENAEDDANPCLHKKNPNCYCNIQTPRITYCAHEVNITVEKMPDGAQKLTCYAPSYPPSHLVWESSIPKFKASRDQSIVTYEDGVYTCRASFPMNAPIKCEVRFSTVETRSRSSDGSVTYILIGLMSTMFISLLVIVIALVIKGMKVNNKKAIKIRNARTRRITNLSFLGRPGSLDIQIRPSQEERTDPLRQTIVSWVDTNIKT